MRRIYNNFLKYRFLLIELVKKGIKLRYRRSYLGIVWSLLEPLLMMIVLTFVFGSILGRSGDGVSYPVYILSGRLCFTFFSSSTRSSLRSIRANSGMIKKVYVPKYLYPLSEVLYNYVIFLISLIVLVAVSCVLGVYPKLTWLLAFVPLLQLLLFSFGVSMLLATIGVFFRDMEYLWSVVTTLLMYMSAIFYFPNQIFGGSSDWKMKIVELNPVYCIITNFRNCVFGSAMNLQYLAYTTVISVVFIVVGVYAFVKKQDRFILEI